MSENIKDMTQEELEQLQNCECEEEQPLDDRLVEVELEKELLRIEREQNAFEFIPMPDQENEISKEVNRDAEAYANFYSRLVLSGVHSDVAGQLLMNYMTCRHNISQAKLDVEKAKYQNILMQQQTI